MTHPIERLDVPQAAVESEALSLQRLFGMQVGRAAEARHLMDPAEAAPEAAFAAMACLHPEACACDETYPGWAEHISKRAQEAKAYRAAARFNAAHQVGTPVTAYPGFRPEGDRQAEQLVTATRSKATVLGGHTAVVWVEDHPACIALTHIDVRPGGAS